jgi:hypothetical protein
MDILALIEQVVNGLIKIEEDYLSNPKDLRSLEVATKTTTDDLAASFLSGVLTDLNKQIYSNSYRKSHYNVQRTRQRSLLSSVGELTFSNTVYRKKGSRKGGYTSLLSQVIDLDKNERFTEEAEVTMLTEALKTSYAEAARSIPSKQKITKTTVMNKVHNISDTMPPEEPEEQRHNKYLFIEADEDHISEQHGDQSKPEDNKGFISKLVYIYEDKQDAKGYKDRKELVNKHYFSGVYPGREGTEKLWNEVEAYIEKTYDTDSIKRIFISGDGASWIKSGTSYVDRSIFCADKYHLMQYINAAAGQMLDDKEEVKAELWHILNSKNKAKERFDKYTAQMQLSAERPERIENLRNYVLGNWSAVRRTLRNKLVYGCSAESHVSHMLSDRLSSRPMGWSQTGADRMSKLRCYERNHGREKIIDLVRYSREQQKAERTGTDNKIIKKLTVRDVISEHYDQARSYFDRYRASIPGITAKKITSIRTHLRDL